MRTRLALKPFASSLRALAPDRIRLMAFIALLGTLGSSGFASEAIAQESEGRSAEEREARALFSAGEVAYSAGRYEDALERFSSAYELSGRPELLYNIGLSADRLRRDEDALEAFEGYLEAVPDSPHRAVVESRVASIRQSLAERRALEAAAAESEAEAAESRAAAVAAQEAAAAAESERNGENRSVAKTWWFWTIVGVVAAGAVTGIVLGTQSGRQDPVPGDFGVVVQAQSW